MNENFDIDLELDGEEALEAVEDVEKEENFLYSGETDEKKTEPYDLALRSVVFGSLSIIIALFAWLFSLLGSAIVPLLVAGGALAIAITGFVSAKKCGKLLPGTLSEGMMKTGKIVSIIALIASSVILAYTLAVAIISVVLFVFIVLFYLFVYFINFMSFLLH